MTDGRWSAERVLSLATDASSARAARGLARPEVWTSTGSSPRALWGHCRGTSPKPYQVAIDLTGPAYRCTCPSRKTPCKHALALLLLWPDPLAEHAASTTSASAAASPTEARGESAADREADLSGTTRASGTTNLSGHTGTDSAIGTATDTGADDSAGADGEAGEAGEGNAAGGEPGWVGVWLDERAARAEQSAGTGGRAGRTAGRVADPEAAKARAERRAERVASGVAELRTWLGDRVRRGLGGFEQNGYSELNRLAARMVDAQAPGLAGALRRAAANVGRGHDWPSRLLEDLAMIHVTAQAHERLAELPGPLAESVRTRIGWTTETARVQAEGERVTDDWLVLGRVVELDERLTTRRIWLRGTRTGRTALLLTFAPAGQYLDPTPAAPGEHLTATLAFYPAAHPLRALITPPDNPDNPADPSAKRSAPPHESPAWSADQSRPSHDTAAPHTDASADTSADASASANRSGTPRGTDSSADPSGPSDVSAEPSANSSAESSVGAATDGRDDESADLSAPRDASADASVGASGVGAADAASVGGVASVGGTGRLGEPEGVGVNDALGAFAGVLAVDPWVERVAVVLKGVRPGRNGDGWALVDEGGDGVELSAYADPWPLLAVSAGGPVTVAGEWGRGGLVPMTCWHGGRVVALT